MSLFTKTIAAISTPPGKGGVAVIRISGADAKSVASSVFKPLGKLHPNDAPRKAVFGKILKNGEEIDDGIAVFFPCPNSYTGEDTVEISCHGGLLITRSVLEACFIAGAVPAEAGEFTKRAFINGKITLTDADAVGLMLDAESEGQLKLTRSAARQKLNEKIEAIRASITSLLSSIFARIDYPEEDLGDFTDEEVLSSLSAIKEKLLSLLSTYKTGRAIREGITTVIVGSPNAGKSTLYNLLGGDDAAIVTDIPGTTRDLLERTVPLGNLILRITDTAGIRKNSDDPIENIGIERSRQKLSESELIFALFDGSKAISDEDKELISLLKNSSGTSVAIITKADISSEKTANENEKILSQSFSHILKISAKNDSEAIRLITEKCESLFIDGNINIGSEAVISSARQNASLTSALGFIDNAINAYELGLPQDVSSSDIEFALGAISEIDGRAVSEAVVSDIFSKFCVGK